MSQLIILIAIVVLMSKVTGQEHVNETKICSMDVFPCLDGSSLHRDPLKGCNFPECPGKNVTAHQSESMPQRNSEPTSYSETISTVFPTSAPIAKKNAVNTTEAKSTNKPVNITNPLGINSPDKVLKNSSDAVNLTNEGTNRLESGYLFAKDWTKVDNQALLDTKLLAMIKEYSFSSWNESGVCSNYSIGLSKAFSHSENQGLIYEIGFDVNCTYKKTNISSVFILMVETDINKNPIVLLACTRSMDTSVENWLFISQNKTTSCESPRQRETLFGKITDDFHAPKTAETNKSSPVSSGGALDRDTAAIFSIVAVGFILMIVALVIVISRARGDSKSLLDDNSDSSQHEDERDDQLDLENPLDNDSEEEEEIDLGSSETNSVRGLISDKESPRKKE